ncbi:MAG: hypothetical protein FWC54_00385 [Actinomycetia bacterium]|nr:hypothetical protein [Actinomycetes bacterium]
MKMIERSRPVRLKKFGIGAGIIIVCAGGVLVCLLALTHQEPFRKSPSGGELTSVPPAGEDATQSASSLEGHDPTGEYGSQIGQVLSVGGLDFTVTKVAGGPTASDGAATTALTITVTNKTATDATIDPRALSAIDRTQGDVPQAAVAGAAQGEQTVPAGQTLTFTLYFAGSDIGRVVYSANDANATQLTWQIK